MSSPHSGLVLDSLEVGHILPGFILTTTMPLLSFLARPLALTINSDRDEKKESNPDRQFASLGEVFFIVRWGMEVGLTFI